MTVTGWPQLQDACIAALRADEFFMALCPGGAHDALPANPTLPYVVIDLPVETPDRTFGQGGHSIDAILFVYVQDGTLTRAGRGTTGKAQASAIIEAAWAVLASDDVPIPVEGHEVADMDIGSCSWVREDDTNTTRAELEFTATLEDEL